MQDSYVWDLVLVAESWSVVCNEPLQRNLVDVNKGDFEKPMVRSRYVATEFAKDDQILTRTAAGFHSHLLLFHADCQAPEVAKSW